MRDEQRNPGPIDPTIETVETRQAKQDVFDDQKSRSKTILTRASSSRMFSIRNPLRDRTIGDQYVAVTYQRTKTLPLDYQRLGVGSAGVTPH
jgi:type IV secretory pathway ATPase VirB11/archaellum biosynthesis ATPase